MHEAASQRLSFLSIVLGVVDSTPFQKRTKTSGSRKITGSVWSPCHTFITKKSISRRRILRGIGAALALPLLESMVPA